MLKSAGKVGNSLMKWVDFAQKPGGMAAIGATVAGLSLFDEIADTAGNIFEHRYKTMNNPIWEAMGKHELYTDYDNMAQHIRQQEAKYKMKYDMPINIMEHAGKGFSDYAGGQFAGAGSSFTEGLKGNRAFQQIASSAEVRAMGKIRAKQLYDQVSAISPGLVRRNPNIALSIIQNANATGSTAMSADTAKNLAQAAGALDKI